MSVSASWRHGIMASRRLASAVYMDGLLCRGFAGVVLGGGGGGVDVGVGVLAAIMNGGGGGV